MRNGEVVSDFLDLVEENFGSERVFVSVLNFGRRRCGRVWRM